MKELGSPLESREQLRVPVVFEYLDFRAFLNDFIQFRKSNNPSYSYAVFARTAGSPTPDLVRSIVLGKRNLTDERIPQFARALGLEPVEARYFDCLVKMNQATTEERQQHWKIQLDKARPTEQTQKLLHEQTALFSKWHLAAIYEMMNLRDFQPSGEWISAKLGGLVHAHEAETCWSLLRKLNFVAATEGRFQPTYRFVECLVTQNPEWLRQYHERLGAMGTRLLRSIPSKDREYGAVTLAVKRESIIELKTLVQEFQRQLLKLNAECGAGDDVFQINIQCFPLTKKDPL